MRAIVTGGGGFIGSHLTDELINQGYEVIIIDNFSTGRKKQINKKAILWRGEKQFKQRIGIENYFETTDVIEGKIDIIYHLAALARIQPSFANPLETYHTNSTGTIVALEMAKHYGCKLVYAGSSTAYDDIHSNPYAYTKWLGEQHCKLYHKIYQVPCGIARFFNVYGHRQLEDGPYSTVIGIFERQFRNNQPLTITGDGKQRRDFLHVKDVVSGLIAIGKHECHATTFDLGTGKNYSINEVASMFGGPTQYIPKRPGEADTTLANVKFTKKVLGWTPKMKLQDYVANVKATFGA